jgi:hypothetical protein
MKFYTVQNAMGTTFDAFAKLSDAKIAVKSVGLGTVQMIEVDVNAETVRLLLACNGGYAKDCKQVWELE